MLDAILDWVTDRPFWGLAIVVAVVAAIIGGIYVATGGKAFECPKGQHMLVTGYIPVSTGKVTTLVPITECVSN